MNERDKLIIWFVKNYRDVMIKLENTRHYPTHRTDHPYHLEGSVWTHTMMVMTHIESTIADPVVKKILLTVGMLHDLGKVDAFKNKGNERYSFEGHEGISTFQAIDILVSLEKDDDFYNKKMRLSIIKLISIHGTDNRLSGVEAELADLFRKSDKLGAVRNEKTIGNYPRTKLAARKPKHNQLILLCGLPGSGKSTLRNKEYKDHYCISRDDELLKQYNTRYAETHGEKTKSEVYQFITQDETRFKQFNEYFNDYLVKVAKSKPERLIIDMTLLSLGSRRKMLNIFSDYEAHCECFLIGDELITHRNNERVENGESLNHSKFIDLKRKFVAPVEKEGFETINYYID